MATYWSGGYLRDTKTGALIVTTSVAGSSAKDGLLRAPNGALVVR